MNRGQLTAPLRAGLLAGALISLGGIAAAPGFAQQTQQPQQTQPQQTQPGAAQTQAQPDRQMPTAQAERGYLGLRLQEITPELARALGLQDASGALVAHVEPGSPAAQAGIEPGDVVTSFSGEAIQTAEALARAVGDVAPGTQVPLKVSRDGTVQDLSVTLGQRGRQAGQTGAVPPAAADQRLGVALSPLDEEARRRLGLDAGALVVREVAPNSPAAQNGIQPGDIILSVNRRDVTQASEIAEEWASSLRENKPLLLRVNREGQYRYIAVGAS